MFGYDNIGVTVLGPDGQPRRSHVERRVNEAEAAVVRRVFELCAEGHGLKRTAHVLNAEGAAAPNAHQGRPHGWAPSSLRPVLFRELYRGQVVWNRTRKRNRWGIREQSTRGQTEWIRVEAPALRIVSDSLWRAAHAKLSARRAVYLRGTKGNPWGRPPTGGTTKYLLSGLSRCGVCGGGFIVRSRAHGQRRSYRYRCYCNHTRGRAVCASGSEVLRDVAETAVIDLLEHEVLQPATMESALDQAVAALTGRRSQADDRRKALEARLAAIDRELTNLAATAAAGGNVPAVAEAIRLRQQRRDEAAEELRRLTCDRAGGRTFDAASLRQALRKRLDDWRDLLHESPVGARRVLETALADRITFTPTQRKDGRAAYDVRVPFALDRVFVGELPIGLASPTGLATEVPTIGGPLPLAA